MSVPARSRRNISPPRRTMSDARREELLGRLEGLFLGDGFRRLTIDDISSALQCSKSTLYALATSKDQLVIAVMKHFFREATVYVEKCVADTVDPRERISVYLAAVGDRMRRMSAACYADMTSSEGPDMIYQLNARASARRVHELISESVDSRRLRPAYAEFVAQAASLLIDGIMHGELLERTGLTSGEAYHQLSVLVLKATAVEPPSRRAEREDAAR